MPAATGQAGPPVAGPPAYGPRTLDDELVAAFRAHSLETGFFLHAVADRLDMTPTDFSCLTLLLLEGPCTAGHLAERTGRTSGAITGVVDRLASQGRVRRAVDPADRRRVVVEPIFERARDLVDVVAPMVADARRIHAGYNQAELKTVLRFMGEARQLVAQHTTKLRSAEPFEETAGVVTVPRGNLRHAGLHIAGLAARMVVRAADLGDALCHVDLGGPTPSVRASAGHVLVQLRGRARAAGRGEVLLNADVSWSVEISGGCSFLDVDLSETRVTNLTVRGGARRLELDLPEPDGVVPVRVVGGASRLTVRRPRGVPVSVRVRGGASEVVVDGKRLGSGIGRIQMSDETVGLAGYELELHGGASRLVVEER